MNQILAAVLEGASRPVKTLPGEYANQFVKVLYDEAARSISGANHQRFLKIRSCVACAIHCANGGEHQQAMIWRDLANNLCSMQTRHARPLSESCLKAAEAYLYFAQQQYEEALVCLDAAEGADATLPADAFPAVRAQRLHYRHLRSRTMAAAGDLSAAIQLLTESLIDAAILGRDGFPRADLLSFACSRMAGELAIVAHHANCAEDYIASTKILEEHQLEGSVAEYLRYRSAWIHFKHRDNTEQLIDLLKDGRMKTVCWYVATCDLAAQLDRTSIRDLAILSSDWRDMPKSLRNRLLSPLMQAS